jgi:hypothetical protein
MRGGRPHIDYMLRVLATAPANLVAYLPRGEAAGTTALDASGNGRTGADSNVTLGQTGIGDGRTAPSYNGTTSFTNWYSAGFAAAFPGQEGTLLLWLRVASSGVWSDATARRLVTLQADTSNRILIQKQTTANTIVCNYIAGATNKTVTLSSLSATTAFPLALTWSKAADQVKAYVAGVQVGTTLTGLGTFAGSLNSLLTAIGTDAISGGAFFWSCMLTHVALWSTPLTAGQVANLATP